MKPAHLAAALLLLACAGCRSSSTVTQGPSSTTPRAPPPPPSAEPTATASAEPTATATAAAPPPSLLAHPIVREEADITIDGVNEAWRIEWTTAPTDACFDYDQRSTCLCEGLTFGESGSFDIVRSRPGLKEQRLHLSGTLQRWPSLPADRDDKHVDVANVKKRPTVPLLRFDDYNHDGKKAEIVLQTEAGNPCARTPSVLVGVNFYTNTLQIFGTGKSPSRPLVLEHRSEWEKVKARNPLTIIELACGDHGSPNQVSLLIEAKKGVFSAREVRNECSEDFSKVGKVVSAEDQ